MDSSNIYRGVLLWALQLSALLHMSSSCSCSRATSSVKVAFCSSPLSFKGTVVSRGKTLAPPNSRNPSGGVVIQYRIHIDEIYRGIRKTYSGRTVTVGSENTDCGVNTLRRGHSYAFQVRRLKKLTSCDRVDRFSDVTRLERIGLRKRFVNVCLPEDFQSERRRNVEAEERGNYYGRNQQDPGRSGTWDARCQCLSSIGGRKSVEYASPDQYKTESGTEGDNLS